MTLSRYTRSLDQFVRILDQMPTGAWDAWSPCSEWTAREIVGHIMWSQQLVHAWVAGTEPPSYRYCPGGDRPGPLVGTDPVAAGKTVQGACAAVLDRHALARDVETRAGATTVGAFLANLTVDNTAHVWDLGTTAGLDVRLDADLVDNALRWAKQNEMLVRESGMFADVLTPPEPADAQTRLLAALGRRAW